MKLVLPLLLTCMLSACQTFDIAEESFEGKTFEAFNSFDPKLTIKSFGDQALESFTYALGATLMSPAYAGAVKQDVYIYTPEEETFIEKAQSVNPQDNVLKGFSKIVGDKLGLREVPADADYTLTVGQNLWEFNGALTPTNYNFRYEANGMIKDNHDKDRTRSFSCSYKSPVSYKKDDFMKDDLNLVSQLSNEASKECLLDIEKSIDKALQKKS